MNLNSYKNNQFEQNYEQSIWKEKWTINSKRNMNK